MRISTRICSSSSKLEGEDFHSQNMVLPMHLVPPGSGCKQCNACKPSLHGPAQHHRPAPDHRHHVDMFILPQTGNNVAREFAQVCEPLFMPLLLELEVRAPGLFGEVAGFRTGGCSSTRFEGIAMRWPVWLSSQCKRMSGDVMAASG